MITVKSYKLQFPLASGARLSIPYGAELLRMGLPKGGCSVVWFKVDDKNPIVVRTFVVFREGEAIPDEQEKVFHSFVATLPGELHVFERLDLRRAMPYRPEEEYLEHEPAPGTRHPACSCEEPCTVFFSCQNERHEGDRKTPPCFGGHSEGPEDQWCDTCFSLDSDRL